MPSPPTDRRQEGLRPRSLHAFVVDARRRSSCAANVWSSVKPLPNACESSKKEPTVAALTNLRDWWYGTRLRILRAIRMLSRQTTVKAIYSRTSLHLAQAVKQSTTTIRRGHGPFSDASGHRGSTRCKRLQRMAWDSHTWPATPSQKTWCSLGISDREPIPRNPMGY
jgi:hypothetical protein